MNEGQVAATPPETPGALPGAPAFPFRVLENTTPLNSPGDGSDSRVPAAPREAQTRLPASWLWSGPGPAAGGI